MTKPYDTREFDLDRAMDEAKSCAEKTDLWRDELVTKGYFSPEIVKYLKDYQVEQIISQGDFNFNNV